MITKIEKFGAPWCGPCKALDKTLEQITQAEIFNYNVDELEELTAARGIRNIPTLIFYNENGEEVERTTGAISLDAIISIMTYN